MAVETEHPIKMTIIRQKQQHHRRNSSIKSVGDYCNESQCSTTPSSQKSKRRIRHFTFGSSRRKSKSVSPTKESRPTSRFTTKSYGRHAVIPTSLRVDQDEDSVSSFFTPSLTSDITASLTSEEDSIDFSSYHTLGSRRGSGRFKTNDSCSNKSAPKIPTRSHSPGRLLKHKFSEHDDNERAAYDYGYAVPDSESSSSSTTATARLLRRQSYNNKRRSSLVAGRGTGPKRSSLKMKSLAGCNKAHATRRISFQVDF